MAVPIGGGAAVARFRKRLRLAMPTGGRPERGAAVTLALVVSGVGLLAVVATLWIGSLLLAGGSDGGSVHDGGGGGGGSAIGSANAVASAGAARAPRPAGPPPAHLLFLGASAVARAERAKRSARAAAAEGGRPPDAWGAGPFRGSVWAAAATAGGGGGADADAGAGASTALPRPWAAVEMVAVGPHVVRVVRPGAAVWEAAAGRGGGSAAPAGPVTVIVADGDDEVGGLTSALRLLTLGGGCGVVGEVLVHAPPAEADGPPTAAGGGHAADGLADASVALLRRRLFRVAGGGACRHPGVVAAVDPPPPPPVLPPSAPVGPPAPPPPLPPCTLPDEAVAASTRTSAAVAAAAVAAASVGGGGAPAAPPRAAGPKACADTFCRRGCPPVPQGAAIVLTRSLVAALRPAAAACEAATAPLCARCGSQRLYMCVHRVAALPRSAGPVTTSAVPGVRRDTWRREPTGGPTAAVTFHAFERLRRLSVTGTMGGDMRQLADLAARHPGGSPCRTWPTRSAARRGGGGPSASAMYADAAANPAGERRAARL
ncbi:hypothetical protein BU14_0207s0031 [Porphyra umbilicalis]|uniref:Uncharacterized protein n=1 Tax=Porphyra umbilicalis TaxID=2786 RepID=A0A1X6P663_PORUM|nr:hypothetical protein BU14_0207s0031 [Porphyra umbilicalis]|eukprot:OSX76113.1 hypothetical protein BU14_0207s0031 [Porphyra umbilicalis]